MNPKMKPMRSISSDESVVKSVTNRRYNTKKSRYEYRTLWGDQDRASWEPRESFCDSDGVNCDIFNDFEKNHPLEKRLEY